MVQFDDGSLHTGWLELWHGAPPDAEPAWREDRRLLEPLAARLKAALAASAPPDDFEDVPLPPGPPFFRRCWAATRRVPRGETISYADLARAVGSTRSAARAAGQAMRRNPVPIVVPCHRVVGADGHLCGFAGSDDPEGTELRLKRAILELERSPAGA
ncbi:MAG: MGMT family protein [Phycisphaerales bacterium]|nr:MGMT family protein [Phycisphaerales bacterium]